MFSRQCTWVKVKLVKYRSVKNVPKYINRGRDKTRFIQSHIMFRHYKLWKKTWRDIVIRDRVGGWVPPLCINRACECFHKSPFVSHKWETKGSEGQWRRLGGHNGDTTQTKTQLLLGVWGIFLDFSNECITLYLKIPREAALWAHTMALILEKRCTVQQIRRV
jgi:hypothetical protein